MYHVLPAAATFWPFLLTIDKDLADITRKKGCTCGGRLHCANYLRKPRGTSEQLTPEHCLRLSFCCDRDDCRKRTTPPSVRFLGRKVYLGAVIILISALRHGPSPRRVHELSERFGVDRCTIARWQVFWRDLFPQTPFWKLARARLKPLVNIAGLPYALVATFVDDENSDASWARLLRFLSSISIPGALQIKLS